jgi:hypothetical protein
MLWMKGYLKENNGSVGFLGLCLGVETFWRNSINSRSPGLWLHVTAPSLY